MLFLSFNRHAAGLLFALSAAAAAAAAAAAGPDRPGDYAHAIPVTVSGSQAIVQLQVPRAVYLEARSGDLRDLRLFDAAGTPMPFALVDRMQPDKVSTSTAPVAVFPVRGPAGARQGLPDGLQIRTREDGTVISVTPPAARTAGDELASLVLDMRPANTNAAAQADVAALVLSLPPGIDSYSAHLTLDTSDDLQRWEPLTDASVSWLVNSQGNRVLRNRIEFAPRPFRYARIAWTEGKPVEFATIHAEQLTRIRAPEQWENLVLQPDAGQGGDDLVYAAPVAVPVETVGVVFQGHNVVLPALVGPWQEQPGRQGADLRPLARSTFYRLTQNGQERVSGDVDVPLTHAARWVLRPQAKVAERPALRLGWKPATMVFMAGGQGPYTLAFGRDGAEAGSLPLAQVAPGFSITELAALEQARAGAAVRQRSDGGAATPASGMLQRREIWLWALLLCGVAALGAMAWRLARQMREGSGGQPPG